LGTREPGNKTVIYYRSTTNRWIRIKHCRILHHTFLVPNRDHDHKQFVPQFFNSLSRLLRETMIITYLTAAHSEIRHSLTDCYLALGSLGQKPRA
ncbi:hypothetical protein LSH36_216g06003, partial [Paralvinella palmiformis]